MTRPLTADAPWPTADAGFITADGGFSEVWTQRGAVVLPDYAFAREVAIAGADAGIQDLDVGQITRARDPATAPAAILPRLAWERSVDVWDPAWPEATRRAVVVAAPEVHRVKGTVRAVKRALDALGVDATVTPWFQEVPRGAPYTFSVTAFARARLYDGPLLDARLIRAIYTSVLRAKPLSRAFDLTVAASFGVTQPLTAAVTTRSRLPLAAVPRAMGRDAVALGLAAVAVARTRVALAVIPVLPPA